MSKRECFVIMPFGDKPDVGGQVLDFDEVYEHLIQPAIAAAGLECIRCDKIKEPGWIHKEMIEHIYAADVAVVDITTLNANVFYELGVRQALRPSVTVLIRRKGTKLPFNLQGLNVVEYDLGPASLKKAVEEITTFVNNGLKKGKSDSLVHEALRLKVSTRERPLAKQETVVYELTDAPGKEIRIVTGAIQNIKDIDVWVNSENTDMLMARFCDSAVSAVIRYHGAEKSKAGRVTKDLIADELGAIVGTGGKVDPATIIETSAGKLQETNGVKRIFHAAAAQGQVGHGYNPIPNVAHCVTNALAKADAEFQGQVKSILFPIMGTGTARGDLQEIAGSLIEAACAYLAANPGSTIERACFVAWSVEQLAACRAVLDNSPAVKAR